MGVVLDTSVLIAAERRRLDMPAFLESLGETSVAMAAITAAELLYGVERATGTRRKARRAAFVEALLEVVPAVPFGLTEARHHATLWANLTKRGTVIGPHDLLVAATALANDLAVATLNRREFERVPGLELVPIDTFQIPSED